MAKNAKSKKSGKVKAESSESESGATTGLDRVINREAVQPNWRAFSDFIEAAGGPKINPKHVGIVLTGYKFYQKSDDAVAAREEAEAEKEAAAEAREAAKAKREEARAAKAAEREEKKAKASEAKKAKAAKASKSAAAASKPKKATKAKDSEASKPKTAKKKAGKKSKAAF
jgi:hypothetical protein